jgi:hypothetical protein
MTDICSPCAWSCGKGRGAGARPLRAFDERSRMKFDNTLCKRLYRQLAPGASVTLLEGRVRRAGAIHELRWGPFTLDPKAGSYRAKLVFEHRARSWTQGGRGDPARKRGTFTAIYLGTLTSNEITLRLP